MSSLDQNLLPATQDTSVFLSRAEHVVGSAMEEGSFEYAFLYVQQLRALQRATGLGSAKTLHLINLYWDKIDHDEETFIAQAVRLTGYSELHIKRLVCAWEMLSGNYIPQPFREKISEQTLQCLFKESQLVVLPRPVNGRYEFVGQDYHIEESEWRALAEAPDERTVGEIVSEIKGKPRNKNLTTFVIEDNGDVFVYRGKDSDFLFPLPVTDEREWMQKVVGRVVEKLEIVRRNEY